MYYYSKYGGVYSTLRENDFCLTHTNFTAYFRTSGIDIKTNATEVLQYLSKLDLRFFVAVKLVFQTMFLYVSKSF